MEVKQQIRFLSFNLHLTRPRVVSPPARISVAESPSVTEEGKIKTSLEVAGGGEIFGPDIQAGTLRISKGISNNREVSVRPILGMVEANNKDGRENRFLGLALDLKKRMNPNTEWWAVSIWGGGGYLYSPYGNILSTHGGLSIGVSHFFLAPYFTGDVFISDAFNTKPISEHVGESNRPDEQKSLTNTVGAKATIGLKIKVFKNFALTSAAPVGSAQSQTDGISYFLLGQSAEISF